MSFAITNEVLLNTKNSVLSKCDTDKNGIISVFEAKKIKSTADLALYNNELTLQRQSKAVSNPLDDTKSPFSEEDKTAQIKQLEEKLKQAKDTNGFIGKAFNKIKEWTKIGIDAKECETIIDDYKNGKITYEEAEGKIEAYKNGQTNSVNTATSLVIGVATTAILASAVMTGGPSIGVGVLVAAGVGAVLKTGLKIADRATNNIKNDEFDAKQLGKDALSGVLDGAVSVGMMGLGTSAVTLKTVTEQTAKQVVKTGIIQGAKAGAISGATMGVGNYSIEAAFEEDVDFKVKDFLETTAVSAAFGALLGGAMGGIGNKIQYRKQIKALNGIRKHFPDKTDTEIAIMAYRKNHFPTLTEEQIATLSEKATELENLYKYNDEVLKQLNDVFPKNELSSIEKTSARVKSEKSVFTKLANKFKKDKLALTDDATKFFDAIGDAYGTRVQLKALSAEETEAVIAKALKDCNFSRGQLIQALRGNYSGLSEAETNSLRFITSEVLDELKEKQTKEVVDALIKGIRDKKIVITELNNYGDDLSSYFTESQIERIVDANFDATGKPLTVITKQREGGTLFNMHKNPVQAEKVIFEEGAVKGSGYATSQMNVEYTFNDGSRGFGELQIRGAKLNAWGDAEHVPYDIRSSKITETDTEYASIYKALKNMNDDCYAAYQKYSTEIYNWYRLQEFGIVTPDPQMPTGLVTNDGQRIPSSILKRLAREGLIKFSKH